MPTVEKELYGDEVLDYYDLMLLTDEQKEKYKDQIVKIFNSNEINELDYDLNDEIILLVLGIYYFDEKNNYDLAIKYLQLASHKNNIIAIKNLAGLYNMYEDTENAIKYYQMAIDRGYIDEIQRLGDLYYYNIDKENAIKYYQMAIDNNCASICVFENLGNLYYYNGDKENAIKYYQMVEHNNRQTIIKLVDYYKLKKNYDQMLRYYLTAVDLNSIEAMNKIGYYYETIKSYDQMIKYYQMAIDNHIYISYSDWFVKNMYLNPTFPMIRLGHYYKTIKNYEQAKKYYNMTINFKKENNFINNNISNALSQLGHIYQIEENYDQMKKYYILAIKKGNVNSMYNLGCYYKKISKNKLMERYFKMCLENEIFDEDIDETIKNNIIKTLANYYESIDDFEQMEKYYCML